MLIRNTHTHFVVEKCPTANAMGLYHTPSMLPIGQSSLDEVARIMQSHHASHNLESSKLTDWA